MSLIEAGQQRLRNSLGGGQRKEFNGKNVDSELDGRMVICVYVENQPEEQTLASRETLTGIKRFSEEQKKALAEIGWGTIYELAGQGFKTLKAVRRNSSDPLAQQQDPDIDFEQFKSKLTEAAFNFNELFLVDSGSKSSKEQETMIDEFSLRLSGKVPGVKAIMGNLFDYAELAHKIKIARGGEYPLFSPDIYMKGYARTNTIVDGERTAVVNFYRAGCLYVSSFPANRGDARVPAAPLVVPV